jgi:hypothetical protein
MVGTGRAYVEGALAKIVDFVREAPQVTITDFRVDFV